MGGGKAVAFIEQVCFPYLPLNYYQGSRDKVNYQLLSFKHSDSFQVTPEPNFDDIPFKSFTVN